MYRNKRKLNLSGRMAAGAALAAIVCLSPNGLLAQKRLITAPIDEDRRGNLTGHVHPLATEDNEVGVLNGSEQIPAMTLTLGRTLAQEADLTAFLAAQQDPSSADYHRWLTPEDYGRRFGAA